MFLGEVYKMFQKKAMVLVLFSILINQKWMHLPNKVKFSNLKLHREAQSYCANETLQLLKAKALARPGGQGTEQATLYAPSLRAVRPVPGFDKC